MLNLNKVMLIGNLTRDPELRYTPAGQSVTSFTIATNRRWTDSTTGEAKESAEFTDIVAWGKLAETCNQILAKGKRVYAEGRLQTRSWEGNDGLKRYKTEIVAESIIALDRPDENTYSKNIKEKAQKSPTKETETQTEEKIDENKTDVEKEKKKEKISDNEEEINLDDIPF